MTSKDSNGEKDKGVWEKIQITQDPDCVSCKIIGMLTLYGAGILVLTNVRKVPQSNKVGRFGMGVFGIGLLGAGTMRLFVS